jgi:hypothetical protein
MPNHYLKMTKVFWILSCLLTCGLAHAQTDFRRNDVYLEAGGAGLFGSVNYERQLTTRPGLGARIGVGFYTEKRFYLTIPVGVNYLFGLGSERAFIEASLTASFTRDNARLFSEADPGYSHNANFLPAVGYRRHTDRGLMWRASATVVFNRWAVTPWLGFALGKRL